MTLLGRFSFFASCFFASWFVACCFVSFLSGSCFCGFSPAGPGFCAACFGTACLACFSGACFDGTCLSCGCCDGFVAAAAPSPKHTTATRTMAPARPATPPNPKLRANPRQVRHADQCTEAALVPHCARRSVQKWPSEAKRYRDPLIAAACRYLPRDWMRSRPIYRLNCTGRSIQFLIELHGHRVHCVPPDHAPARAIAGAFRDLQDSERPALRNPSCGGR